MPEPVKSVLHEVQEGRGATFRDDDGCPDLDNDEDGILDVCDQCPNEPETYNGTDDDDGCADQAHVIVVHDIRIRLLVRVSLGADRVEAASPALQPELVRARIAGDRVLVAVRPDAQAEQLVRAGKRIADVLDAQWTVV